MLWTKAWSNTSCGFWTTPTTARAILLSLLSHYALRFTYIQIRKSPMRRRIASTAQTAKYIELNLFQSKLLRESEGFLCSAPMWFQCKTLSSVEALSFAQQFVVALKRRIQCITVYTMIIIVWSSYGDHTDIESCEQRNRRTSQKPRNESEVENLFASFQWWKPTCFRNGLWILLFDQY